MFQNGSITSHLDLAQMVLYAFWLFFACLILYLRREDRREGYPLLSDGKRPLESREVLGFIPRPKFFRMPDGRVLKAPRKDPPEIPFKGHRTEVWEGAPLEPVGNPMLSGVGPAAYANRIDQPERLFDGSSPVIAPLRIFTAASLDPESPQIIGYEVVGFDGGSGGVVVDVWADRVEAIIRYLEVQVPTATGPRHVLLPMPLARVDRKRRIVKVATIRGEHFADVPVTRNPDEVTLLEEDKISAYYSSGQLYATRSRREPYL